MNLNSFSWLVTRTTHKYTPVIKDLFFLKNSFILFSCLLRAINSSMISKGIFIQFTSLLHNNNNNLITRSCERELKQEFSIICIIFWGQTQEIFHLKLFCWKVDVVWHEENLLIKFFYWVKFSHIKISLWNPQWERNKKKLWFFVI